MEEYLEIPISARLYTAVRWHTVMNGMGAIVPEEPVNERNVMRKIDKVGKYVKFLITNSVKTAEATNRKKTDGSIVVGTKLYRKVSISYLIEQFRELEREEMMLGPNIEGEGNPNKREYVAINSEAMILIAKIVCPSIIKCLGALDGNSQTHGAENYEVC